MPTDMPSVIVACTMLTIIENISPVFLVIGLGYLSRKLGFLPDSFIQSANRLVYYIAIPILIFGEISRGNFAESFNPGQIGATFLVVAVIFFLSLGIGGAMRLPPGGRATFSQTSFHGNLGYVGLAVVFYVLGNKGRAAASVLAGFLMLFQNFLSISLFTLLAGGGKKLSLGMVWKFLGNPIILATLLGLVFSAGGVRIPGFMTRTFSIVAEMALPLALLIIGGSLKPFSTRRLRLVALSTALKLAILPMAGFFLFRFIHLEPGAAGAAIIFLASPSATISYVMAAEMGGDKDLAAAAVTASTALSIITYTLWIGIMATS